MIKSRSDYNDYLKEDLIATNIYRRKWFNKLLDRRYKFYKSLRYTEILLKLQKITNLQKNGSNETQLLMQ